MKRCNPTPILNDHLRHDALPPEIHLSLVDSLYQDGRLLLTGSVFGAVSVFVTYWKTGEILLLFCALAIVLVACARGIVMRAYSRARPTVTTANAAALWEHRYGVGASASVALLGIWCYVAFSRTSDPFAHLLSFSMTIAYTIGIFGRNFGSARFVIVQILCAWMPMTAALLIYGNPFYWFFASLLVPFFLSLKFLAGKMRRKLLDAVIASRNTSLLANRFDTALNNIPHGLCMFDSKRRIVVSNHKMKQQLGLSPNLELKGLNLQRFVESVVEAGMISNLDGQGLIECLDARFSGSGDGAFIVDMLNGRTLDFSFQPMKNGGMVVLVEDITERRKAQEALYESEQMARAIIDTALDAFLQLDKNGTVIAWSPKAEEMFGWSHQEIVGQKLHDFAILSERRDAYSERIAQFLRDAENGILGRRYEAPSLRRDGKVINTEISLTALGRRDGFIINGFIRDITEKVAAEEQLRQSQKMESVGQLTGGIAHDFNNMLTTITGTIDMLAEAVADKPELAAVAKLISEAADRGADLTGRLLAFARKQPLQPRETDINALMVESGRLLRPALGEHIEIETILKPGIWPALVDPSQLSSALLNLAINARDAMPNGGKLILETSTVVLDQSYANTNLEVQPGDYVLIAASDTGSGIPKEIREKIFEPFFTTKGVGKGTGLGLSMVYGFVKQSGGHIKVYSEEGDGTTFKIYLPRASAQVDPIAATSSDCQTEGGNETILVVEDDPFVRTSVMTQLRSLGYNILSAANAAEALEIADRGAQFDLLFTDVIMPGKMNGRQLAKEMAKRRSPLKVLYTSGYTEDAVVRHGRLDPGVLLLAKPYRKSELARMLRNALGAGDALPARNPEPLKFRAI